MSHLLNPEEEAEIQFETGYDFEQEQNLGVCLRVANMVVEQVLARDNSLNSRYNYQAMWCKARIKMHQSIYTILRAQSPLVSATAPSANAEPTNAEPTNAEPTNAEPTNAEPTNAEPTNAEPTNAEPTNAEPTNTESNKNVPREVEWELAMGYLSGAEACLNNSEASRQESDQAIIELFRADVRLRQADCNIVKIEENLRFSDLRFNVYAHFRANRAKCTGVLWYDFGKDLRDQILVPCKRLSRSRALAEDSIRFLNRAEEILRGRRRNVWWTTWLFERRLRAIALSIWATAHEEGGSIPFLGLDSSPRETDTIADTLLDNCIRMVRLDAYRLASVVDAYAECAFALRVSLICDHAAPRMQHRQRAMRNRLLRAANILRKLQQERENIRKPIGGKKDERQGIPAANWNMDLLVDNYITQVLKNANGRAEFLRMPLE